MADRVIRVWLDGCTDKNELSALKAWLERETPLEELVRSGDLRIEERARQDTPEGRMGPDWEIVLRVIETSAGIAMLAEQTKRAVDAWRTNRGRVGQGEPPNPRIEPSQDSDEG
ncbi:effector-associated constant component EACC1 [Streptomyces sp. NPDC002073]